MGWKYAVNTIKMMRKLLSEQQLFSKERERREATIRNMLFAFKYPMWFLKRRKIDGFEENIRFHIDLTLPLIQKELKNNECEKPEEIAKKFSFLFYPAVLYGFCKFLKPSVVIETGTGAGLGSTFILAALNTNNKGYLYGIDVGGAKYSSERYKLVDDSFWTRDRQPGWAIPKGLRHRFRLEVGTSQNVLPNLLRRIGRIDLFFHDSEHTYKNMMFEYKTVWPYLKKGGILASHDISWNTAFIDFAASVCREPKISEGDFGWIRK